MTRLTMEQVADRSVEINRDLRKGLYDLLGAVNGLGERDRERLAPRIEAMLERSAGMPTAFHINQAKAPA